MPITGFLKLPDIAGESTHVDHEEEIDIFATHWGVEQLRTTTVGGGRTRGRTEIKPLRVGKYCDAASPFLAQAAAQGKSFDEATISVRKDSGEAHLDYLVITMENVFITSYTLSTDDPDAPAAPLSEEIAFDFERVTILYRFQNPDGSAGAAHQVTLEAR